MQLPGQHLAGAAEEERGAVERGQVHVVRLREGREVSD